MTQQKSDFLLTTIWSYDKDGNKVHPYKGERGEKKGLYSVNLTNNMKNFTGMTQEQLIEAIVSGKFKERGTIRMLPVNYSNITQRNAFSPEYYNGVRVKNFG